MKKEKEENALTFRNIRDKMIVAAYAGLIKVYPD